jgi:hypothetical protein
VILISNRGVYRIVRFVVRYKLMWLFPGQLSADVVSPWYFQLSELKLSKRSRRAIFLLA